MGVVCPRAVSTPATHSSFGTQQSVIAQWATKVGNTPTIPLRRGSLMKRSG